MLTRKFFSYIIHPLVFVVAVVLVFEEWLWDTLKARLRRLGRLPLVAALESRLRKLNPWLSLLILILPGIVLIPFKIAALYLVSHHRPVLGLLVLVGAKLVGTGFAAYLFELVRENARRLGWFDAIYRLVMKVLCVSKDWLRRQASYLWIRSVINKWKTRLRTGRRSWILRKLQAAKILAQGSKNPPAQDQ